MTRLTKSGDPDAVIRMFERRVRELENQNRLNNATLDGSIRFGPDATIQAGDVTILHNGIELPWGAGRQSIGTILDAIDNRAQLARNRADSAHDRIDIVSDRASNALADAQQALQRGANAHDRIDTVSTRATNALNRADSAHDRITTVSGNLSYVNDRVDTVSARATNALNNAATAQARADSAYSLAQGRVTQTQRNVLVARINQIIAVMATEGGNPKPPPIQS